ncbi:hypothetical protein E2542_SST06464 [Spatholobus suberectus]|nr:hypothetical protein E2542_SST06464 [Spatholobus suberectus]
MHKPLMTKGWLQLRSFYGLTGDHSMYFWYFGDNIFQITVWKNPCTPAVARFYDCAYANDNSKGKKGLHSAKVSNQDKRAYHYAPVKNKGKRLFILLM